MTSPSGMLSNFNSTICRCHGSADFGASAAGLGLASGLAGFGWAKAGRLKQNSSAALARRVGNLENDFMVRLRFRVDDIRCSHPEHANRSQITQRKLKAVA